MDRIYAAHYLKQRRLVLGYTKRELSIRVGCNPKIIDEFEANGLGPVEPGELMVALDYLWALGVPNVPPLTLEEAGAVALSHFTPEEWNAVVAEQYGVLHDMRRGYR